ncbi:hypothetical protein EV2_038576 [Malus domestica]
MGSAVIMERVLNLFRSMLCLNEGEEIEAKFSDTAKERLKLSKYFVVRKVLTRKKFRSSIVMRVIKELWRPKVAVEAMAIREDRILLSFNIEDDMRTVLSGNSWFFGKLLPILAEVKGLKVPVNVSLREQEFWIQIHGLPSSLMSVRMREILGVTIGRVVKTTKGAHCSTFTQGSIHEFRTPFGTWLKTGQPILGSLWGKDIDDMDVDAIRNASRALEEEVVHGELKATELWAEQAFKQASLDRVRDGGNLLGFCPNSMGPVTLVLGEMLLTGSKRCIDGDVYTRDRVSIGSKKNSQAMEFKKCGLGFQNSITVVSNGRSEGLYLLWKEEVELVVRSSSLNHINMECKVGRSLTWWRFTGFYGFPNTAERHLSWTRARKRKSQMNGFREAMHYCQLVDLGFIGSEYTWTDNREDEVQFRLDRALAIQA